MTKAIKQIKPDRVHLIDEIRGFAIICMVVYHFFYDLVVLFSVNIPFFYSDFIAFVVPCFAGAFIFISGTACHYSKNNLKRGVICFSLGVGISLVTFFIMPDSRDLFGILHMLGLCMMLFPLISKLIKKVPPVWGMAVCFLLFIISYNIPNGFIGFEGFFVKSLPDFLYSTRFLFAVGLPGPGFFSSDYFPLIPWLFCFTAGGFFGILVKGNRLPKAFYKSHIKPLAFVGRNTIWIYIAHQPILYGTLWLIFSVTN